MKEIDEIISEIRSGFASLQNGYRIIESAGSDNKAFVIRENDRYGVGLICDDELEVNEKFANCRLETKKVLLEGHIWENYLIFSCVFEEYRNEFAIIAGDFVEPGDNGSKREEILSCPLKWWEKWKNLIGNQIVNKEVYSVIGEMFVFEKIYKKNRNAKWTGGYFGTYDIETKDGGYEVKSTMKKYESTISVSSHYQLAKKKPLELHFCRFEKSEYGYSVNDLVKKLLELKYDSILLEDQLNKLGLEKGASLRNEKYNLLEWRIYTVDENFPCITMDSFKNGELPQGITKIVYTVDLEGINYRIGE